MTGKDISHILKEALKGDIAFDKQTLVTYSRDTSVFEIQPKVVIFPKNADDVSAVVRFVGEHKERHPELSITARSAGTCMSGGSINDSIILDFTRYMNRIISVSDKNVVVEPGCMYRNMEKELVKINRMMPSYTASKEICAVGGMVGNNSGGEKTLKFGKTERYVSHLKVIFADGNVYDVHPLSESKLEEKIAQGDFEGSVYRNIRSLIYENLELIKGAKPNVSKNSAGYYLWNVWDTEKKVFDLCKLFVGSQGTLGIVTEITFDVVPTEPYSNVLAIFLPDIKNLGNLVSAILPYEPDSLESYDDYSMKLAVRFFFDFFKYLGFKKTIRLGLQFLPELFVIARGGVPKLTVIVECTGKSEEEIKERLHKIKDAVSHFGYQTHIAKNSVEAEKYWRIRRESFNMLRKHIKGRRTAPFIEDVVVLPKHLPEFLPKLNALLDEYKLIYTIAGHVGDGNLHIIPLMNLRSRDTLSIITELSKKVYDLVHEYHGSITAEHNDGLIRTPYLKQMYGEKVWRLFTETKDIFDRQHIFNPKKKVHGTLEDIKKYLRKTN